MGGVDLTGIYRRCSFKTDIQGFIQDFSTGESSISATVQPPTLHEGRGGGIMPVLT